MPADFIELVINIWKINQNANKPAVLYRITIRRSVRINAPTLDPLWTVQWYSLIKSNNFQLSLNWWGHNLHYETIAMNCIISWLLFHRRIFTKILSHLLVVIVDMGSISNTDSLFLFHSSSIFLAIVYICADQ